MVFRKNNPNGSFGNKLKIFLKRKPLVSVIAIVLLVIILVLSAGFWWFGDHGQDGKTADAQKYAERFIESDNNPVTQSRLVDEYGAKYDETAAKIYQSNPADWDKAMLDDAYTALLYADKMQAYNQVSYFLAAIDTAGATGLDLDDNSYGVNQEIRNAIRQRLSDATQQTQEMNSKVKAEFEKAL